MAGVALVALALVMRLVPIWRRGRRGWLRGRRGIGDMDLHFACRLWRLRHWAGSGDGCLHGRRGTCRHAPSLYVAGMELRNTDLHFAWQAWHLRHWAGSGGAALVALAALVGEKSVRTTRMLLVVRTCTAALFQVCRLAFYCVKPFSHAVLS